MERKGSLLSFRPDIKVLDATLRDGGLCNNFAFSDEFAKALYKMNLAAGVDYMEMGYKASGAMFDPAKFGKYKFCAEEDIRRIVGDNKTEMKLSVMADVGRTDFRKDIGEKKNSVIDMVRVACYITEIPAAIEMIEYCKNKGYETCANVMAVSKARDAEIESALSDDSVCLVYRIDPEAAHAVLHAIAHCCEVAEEIRNIPSLLPAFRNGLIVDWITKDGRGWILLRNLQKTGNC